MAELTPKAKRPKKEEMKKMLKRYKPTVKPKPVKKKEDWVAALKRKVKAYFSAKKKKDLKTTRTNRTVKMLRAAGATEKEISRQLTKGLRKKK